MHEIGTLDLRILAIGDFPNVLIGDAGRCCRLLLRLLLLTLLLLSFLLCLLLLALLLLTFLLR
jgi:hypothetical protein